MKALVTTHAQMFRTPDGNVWTNSVYGYDFFNRYLDVFEEIRLITRMKDISYEEIENRVKVSGPGLEFYSLPFYHGPWQYGKSYFKILRSLSDAIDGCNCAILRIPEQLAFQLFNKVKKANIPCAIEVVAHSRDLYAPGTMKTILRPLLRILWDKNQKKICTEADGVSYVTEKYIQKRYPSKIVSPEKGRFETFYTSADLNDVFFAEPRNRESYEKPVINLVHISGINNTAKGHYELLNALSKIDRDNREYKIRFIGGGTLLNYYKELSKKLGVETKTEFIGHISNPYDIAKILRDSDIFVFPTMTEGLPRVILEAMASGLPCIATDVGGIPELLSSYCLVKPNDIEGLVKKIRELSSNAEILAFESNKNHHKIRSSFSSETIQRKRKVFYEKLREKALLM